MRFAREACTVQTNEGLVSAKPGDAILTGINGEHWRVSQARFPEKYRPAESTTSGEDGAYISLPNRVFAVPMAGFEILMADGVSKLPGAPATGSWIMAMAASASSRSTSSPALTKS